MLNEFESWDYVHGPDLDEAELDALDYSEHGEVVAGVDAGFLEAFLQRFVHMDLAGALRVKGVRLHYLVCRNPDKPGVFDCSVFLTEKIGESLPMRDFKCVFHESANHSGWYVHQRAAEDKEEMQDPELYQSTGADISYYLSEMTMGEIIPS